LNIFFAGVVCVGGDGIVNEVRPWCSYCSWLVIIILFATSSFIALQVLNGLLLRSDRTEAVSNPVGIIPAGSDNSLVCTVLGVRDPISASILIVKVCLVSSFSQRPHAFYRDLQ